MKIEDFCVRRDSGDGKKIAADPYGNNVAFECFQCGHPVLAIARENQRGSKESNPAECRGCHVKYVIEGDEATKTVIVREI